MLSHMTVQYAVSKVYGKNASQEISALENWQLFSTYNLLPSNKKVQVRLIDVPAHYYTSQEVYEQKLQKFQEVLHPVQIVFVERCFQSNFYLLVSQSNLMSVKSLIDVKKQSKEIIDQKIIYNYLHFTTKLQQHPYANEIYFDEDQIAIDNNGNFQLTNYFLYFANENKSQDKTYLNRDIRNVLSKMLTLSNKKQDLPDLYSEVQTRYDKNMVQVVEKCMEPNFHSRNVMQILDQLKSTIANSSFHATISDLNDEPPKIQQDFFQKSTIHGPLLELSFTKERKKLNKKSKIGIFIAIFVAIFIVIGGITYKYLIPRTLTCEDYQYADQESMQCLACHYSCMRCSGAGSDMCISCKGNMFLTLKNLDDKRGVCSYQCDGTVYKSRTCITPR